jgi:hypothetical protein
MVPSRKIVPELFGREPALWIAVVQAALMLAFTLGVPGIDGALAAAVSLVLTLASGVWTALAVRPIAPAVFTGLIIALVQLFSRWGLDLSEVQVSSITAFVALVVTLVARGQITPDADPRTIEGEVVSVRSVRLRN